MLPRCQVDRTLLEQHDARRRDSFRLGYQAGDGCGDGQGASYTSSLSSIETLSSMPAQVLALFLPRIYLLIVFGKREIQDEWRAGRKTQRGYP